MPRFFLFFPKASPGSRLVDRGVAERAFDGFTGMMVQRNDLGDGKCMCMIAALPCGTRPGKGPRSKGERAHGGADGAEHSLGDFAWGVRGVNLDQVDAILELVLGITCAILREPKKVCIADAPFLIQIFWAHVKTMPK